MAVKIRLMRIGSNKRPFYRVVAVDERKKRTGAYLELLGTYNPLTEPKEIILKKDRISYWLKQGAVPSDGYLRIIGEAPKKPIRKPKKDKGKETPVVSDQPSEKQEEAPVEQSPIEEPAAEVTEVQSEEAQEQVVGEKPAETPAQDEQTEVPAEEKKG